MQQTRVLQAERPHDTFYDPVYISSNDLPQGFYSKYQKTLVLRKGEKPSSSSLMGGPLPEAADIAGRDRHRFFRRPIMPYMTQMLPNLLVGGGGAGRGGAEGAEGVASAAPAAAVEDITQAASRTVGTQSMYRESEAQTNPYSPDYVVRPGSQPELLNLEPLVYGNGLPVDQRTMVMIGKIADKQQWLRDLPPMDSEENIKKRHQMMEERELLEWGEREAELNALQARRLAKLEKAMVARENNHAFLEDQRIEFIRQKKMAEKEGALKKIQAERVKAIRRLAEMRKYVETKHVPKDVIGDHVNGGSEVYAPLVRHGVVKDVVSEAVERHAIPGEFLSLEGIQELEGTARKALRPSVARPEKKRPVTIAERNRDVIAQRLDEVDRGLKLAKAKASDRSVPERFLKKVELPPPRPPTPSVQRPDVDEDAEVACMLLQRLLRGRAVQNAMFEGKQKRLELIRELQVVEHHKMEPLRGQLEAEAFTEHKAAVVDSALEQLEGEIVGQTLDFLANELVRHTEEAKIAATVREAEKVRRTREAAESGLRQKEEQVRAEEDARFAHVIKVHQQLADSYLDSVFATAVQTASSLQAIHETRVKAENIISVLDTLEAHLNPPNVVVADLVDNYLIPNVEKETIRREERLDELKFPLAARQVVALAVEELERRGL